MMKSRKLLIVYLVLLALTVGTMINLWPGKECTQTIQNRDYPEIKEEGILRIITEYSSSGYHLTGDTIEGFQYELSQAISRQAGLEVQIQLEMNLETCFQALNDQRCDIIARNIPVTSELKENYLFTDPVVLNKQVLVQRTEAANQGVKPIRNHLELGHKTLYIPQNSPALLRLRNLEEEIGDTIYIQEDNLYSDEQLIIMVAKGDIDYAVCDQQIAESSLQHFPEIDIKTDISFTQLQSWVVRKNAPVLKDSLNLWFARIRENGEYQDIYKRYYQ